MCFATLISLRILYAKLWIDIIQWDVFLHNVVFSGIFLLGAAGFGKNRAISNSSSANEYLCFFDAVSLAVSVCSVCVNTYSCKYV